VLVSVAASSARKADGGLQFLRRIGDERRLRKSTGRNARADHRISIYLGKRPGKLHDRLQVLRACLAGLLKAAASGAASAVAAVLLTAGASVAFPDHHDGHVSAAREPQRLPKLRPWRDVHAILLLVGGSMSQDGQRMTPGPVRVHLQYIEAAGKGIGRWRPHLFLDQSHWRLTGFRVLHGIGIWRLLSCSSQGKEPDQDPRERGNQAHSPQYSRFSDRRSR
jgi:hypothetical protein